MQYRDFYDNVIDDTEDDLVNILKEIYKGRLCSIYVAGTLLCEFKETLYEFNIRPDIIDRLNYWSAKIYIKNKSPSHFYWEASKKIIKHCEERNIL